MNIVHYVFKNSFIRNSSASNKMPKLNKGSKLLKEIDMIANANYKINMMCIIGV
jgi:hypothetical protein